MVKGFYIISISLEKYITNEYFTHTLGQGVLAVLCRTIGIFCCEYLSK